MTLGEMLKEYRTSEGFSMDDAAKKTGLSKAYISILERGFNPSTGKPAIPSLSTIQAVSRFICKDVNDVLAAMNGDQKIDLSQHPAEQDPLIAFYGEVKDKLDESDKADLMTFMRMRAELKNRGKK